MKLEIRLIIFSWSFRIESDSLIMPVPVSFFVYRSLLGKEVMSLELDLCRFVNVVSSWLSCLSFHDENFAEYAILRMVLIIATACFVSKEARFRLTVLHILLAI